MRLIFLELQGDIKTAFKPLKPVQPMTAAFGGPHSSSLATDDAKTLPWALCNLEMPLWI